jgi:hypothetical protein
MGSEAIEKRFNLSAVIVSVLVALAIVLYALLDPDGFKRGLMKDFDGSGLFENLTIIVLVPGIVAGAWAFLSRRRFPHKLTGYWILGWTLACIYFAGEESSWGQCYFQWDTPGVIKSLNDQGEMNFHNMSSWLDQKPRTLVELFVFASVVTAPLLVAIGCGKSLKEPGRLTYLRTWILAPSGLLAAGGLYVLLKTSGFLPGKFFHMLGSSELREFVIAMFLSLYLMSYAARGAGAVGRIGPQPAGSTRTRKHIARRGDHQAGRAGFSVVGGDKKGAELLL